MFLISEEEIGEIIKLTEDMCNTPGWVEKVLPYAKKRMDLINIIRSRSFTTGVGAVLEELDKRCYNSIGAGDGDIAVGGRIAFKEIRLWIAELRQQTEHE
ncbi:MAG: hypothetical protein MUO73_03255 [Thermoplasmata archaeon]|nr:hypothetical protein [Thermoplasmata archaeon]